jgi:Holliday junction resolvasome RuvABC endonuclease subunit
MAYLGQWHNFSFQRHDTGTSLAQGGLLAIDPGDHLGWAVFRPDGEISCGVVSLGTADDFFGATGAFVRELLLEFCPARAVLEKYFMAARGHSGRTIEQRGAIKLCLSEAGVPWEELHPSSVRSSLGIKKPYTDSKIRQAVCNILGVPEKYIPEGKTRAVNMRPDVFDALALGVFERRKDDSVHRV